MKKTIFLISFLMSIFYAAFFGAACSLVADASFGVAVNPLMAGVVFFASRTIYLFFLPTGEQVKNLLLSGLNKEIWIEKLKENFYDEYEWLKKADDWSEWVEFNTINFATMGSDPAILKNNSSWPITAVQRTDTAATVALATYDSTTTRVRNVEQIEASYDKLASVVKQHKGALLQEIVTECLHSYAPATLAAGAMSATGSNRAAVIGSQSTVAKKLTIADIATLQQKYDVIRAPQQGRILVLSPYHREDLLAADSALQKQFADLKTGQALDLYGFKIYVAANAPLYTKSTLAIKAYGAAADNTNDCVASVSFIETEVMKAMGDVEMFYKQKSINPEQRADEVGFQMRFIGAKQRATNNMYQALVSDRA